MSKLCVYVTAALVAAIGLGPTAWAYEASANAVSTSAGSTETRLETSARAAGAVSIGDFFYQPSTVTIAAGETVTWTNGSGTPHTTTSTNPRGAPGGWDSGTLSRGGTFAQTFTSPGTFTYQCNIHGAIMRGTITVTAAAAAPAPTTAPPADVVAPPPAAAPSADVVEAGSSNEGAPAAPDDTLEPDVSAEPA